MKLFKRFRRKNEETLQQMDHQLLIIEICEQMQDEVKDYQLQKQEYSVLTEYLKDVQRIEEMNEEDLKDLKEIAEHLLKIETEVSAFQSSEKKLLDSQFSQMDAAVDEIPDAIRRLKEHEKYQNTVKKDLNYLEGEKVGNQYTARNLLQQQETLKKAAIVVLVMMILTVLTIVAVSVSARVSLTGAIILSLFLFGLSAALLYWKMSKNEAEIKISELNRNQAVLLENKIKYRYVNITNAVDYVCEKYHVRNSKELEYIWLQYQEEAKEREKIRELHEDSDYYIKKLMRLLEGQHMYDRTFWIRQSKALMDKREMVEVKHAMIVRRQKIRENMDAGYQSLISQKNELQELLTQNQISDKVIGDIFKAIDELS